MTNSECITDLERITEVNKLKEQQAVLKSEYIVLKMKEESGVKTYTSITAADIAREYFTIEEQINELNGEVL